MISVWMPCNKDIRNQGLTYSEPTGSYTIVNDGPYGKCVHTTSAASINSQVKSVDGWDVQTSCGFGAWQTATAQNYKGYLRNFSAYKKELTQEDITNLYIHGE